jgi:hypothetical protein
MISAATHEDIITGGGSDDFCLARHLILSGGEEAIGASLAATLERNHGTDRHVASDPTMTRARRRWRRLFYPQLDGRARGIAAHWGFSSEDDRIDTAMLRYGFPAAACSVAWIPPSAHRRADHSSVATSISPPRRSAKCTATCQLPVSQSCPASHT